MFSKNLAAMGFLIGLSGLVTGCEQETTKDQVAEAQYCLDGATDASSANACVAKIASLDTPTANALRCSAGFISAGITTTDNLSRALTAIKDSNSGGSSATTMMSFLNLGSTVNETFNACVASQNKGMALIAAMAKTATTLISLIPSFDPDTIEADLEAAIADLAAANPSDPAVAAQLESVGTAIATVYQSTCSGSSNANSDICSSIDSALVSLPPSADGESIDLSSTSPADIGKQLVDFWKAQNL